MPVFSSHLLGYETLKRAGIPAASLSGVQARIFAGGHPLEAEVVGIDTSRLVFHLGRGEVPVVTGGQTTFRGTLDFVTLGRGASDTSGVLLGVALGAERAEIFTDVIGVATADPRLMPHALWVRRASDARMHDLARVGAKAVHPRAIMAGWKGQTPDVVRSTFSLDPGTLIGGVDDEAPVLGMATLCPMDTRVVAAATIGNDGRAEWERRQLIMSLVDEPNGALVLAAPADRSGELDRVVKETGLTVLARWQSTAWVSVVGGVKALSGMRDRNRAGLAAADAPFHREEHAPGCSTFVVGADRMSNAAASLHRAAFGGD